MHNFLRHLPARITAFVALATCLFVGVVTVHAAAGQILKLKTSDDGTTFYIGRCFRMDIRAQTDQMDINSVDIVIPYNSTYIQPYTNSGCTVSATSILTDGAFSSYPLNTVSSTRIDVIAFDSAGTSPLNTGNDPADAVIGHLFWKVRAASGSFFLPLQFVGGRTTDSNMAEDDGDGTDVLDAVENLTLNLSADSAAPTFSSLSPANGGTNVAVTSDLSYTISDAGAGVNTGSLTTRVNGTSYSVVSSNCTRTNSNRIPSCDASVALPVLSYNTLYRVTATGGDLASPTTNTGSQFWTFTTEDDDDAPYVENRSPSNGATDVAATANIVFRVKDYKNDAGVVAGLGVDISTVQVTVTAGSNTATYADGDAEFSYTGSAENYQITIDPSSNFTAGETVTIDIEASDLHVPANAMTTDTYSFQIASASSTNTTTDSTAGTEVSQNGGTRRPVGRDIPTLTGDKILQIVQRRRISDFPWIVESPLTREQSDGIETCYVDEAAHAAAPRTPFIDVPAGSWYEDAVAALMAKGAIDPTQTLFRGADSALRAEFAKLLTALKGITPVAPLVGSFDDVPLDQWFFPFVETAAQQAWMKGDDSCYGKHPCTARPTDTLTRAEALAMISRYLDLTSTGDAPAFVDVAADAWYADIMQMGGDRCIIQNEFALPNRLITRAEMASMFHRALQDLHYGVDCEKGAEASASDAE